MGANLSDETKGVLNAAAQGNADVLSLLLAANKDLLATNKEKLNLDDALFSAAWSSSSGLSQTAACELLLNAKATLDPGKRKLFLMLADGMGNEAFVKWLSSE